MADTMEVVTLLTTTRLKEWLWWQGWELSMDSKNDLSPTKSDPNTVTAECLSYQQQKPMLSSQYSTILQGTNHPLVTS